MEIPPPLLAEEFEDFHCRLRISLNPLVLARWGLKSSGTTGAWQLIFAASKSRPILINAMVIISFDKPNILIIKWTISRLQFCRSQLVDTCKSCRWCLFQQLATVVFCRIVEKSFNITGFYQPAVFQYCHLIRHLTHDRQIVADE